eukprot:TRINITY_DN39742_c0_g1_i2.p1 TRINITY_DN39742_c0_g1~~TRINITY_DN39742_c0_g1_i2.p1  ORF type:complete len:863 (+),score=237.32 TRINITY_DN39742_c0_g1_i2:116-2704(+)
MESGLLTSMTDAQLVETCKRLQRSIGDMNELLGEFEEEHELLRRDRRKLKKKIENVKQKMERSAQDKGLLGNLLNDLDRQLEGQFGLSVPAIFKAAAKDEKRMSESSTKRRRTDTNMPTPERAPAFTMDLTNPTRPAKEPASAAGVENNGPFSDRSLQLSWGRDVALGALRTPAGRPDLVELDRWLKETMSPESVAEAEAVPESWRAMAPVVTLTAPSPSASPASSGQAALLEKFSQAAAGQAEKQLLQQSGSRQHLRVPSATDGMVQPLWKAMGFDAAPVPSRSDDDEGGSPLPPSPAKSSGTEAKKTTKEASGLFGYVANWMNVDSRDPDAASQQSMVTSHVNVVLRREGDNQKWGLGWHTDKFRQDKERIVKELVPGSVAEAWNKQQLELGQKDKCILQEDRLVSANGKTKPDDIKNELKLFEVVLEFVRVRRAGEVAAETQSLQPESPSGPAGDGRPVAGRHRRQTAFSAALSGYLEAAGQTATPSSSSQAPPPKTTFDDEEAPPPAVIPAATSAAAMDAKTVASNLRHEIRKLGSGLKAFHEEGDEEDDGAAASADASSKPAHEAPHAVVAQVISRGRGEAPADVASSSSSSRAFEVLQYSGDAEAVRRISIQPSSSLKLEVGHRHRFQVQAVVLERDSEGEANAESKRLWTSPASEEVSVDLRGAGVDRGLSFESMQEVAEVARAAAAEASPAPSPVASPAASTGSARPRPKGVASKFESFLAQPRRQEAMPEVSIRAPPIMSPVTSSTPAGTRSFSNQMASASSSAQPLLSSQPRVVTTSGPLDPQREKMELEERLRFRAGPSRIHQEDTSLARKIVSMENDSDDENSLMKLSSALVNLERHRNPGAATKPPGEE